jgi:hypothetical protein
MVDINKIANLLEAKEAEYGGKKLSDEEED